MQFSAAFLSLLLHGATASPIHSRQSASSTTTNDITHDPNPAFPIHSSCNITLRHQLSRALDEAVQISQQAKNHLLLYGLDSPLTQKYFGNASTGEPIGWYDRIISASRGDMLFRCDDPDKNCATQDAWAGHWRGSNATQETVICPLSFQPGKRQHLDAVCGWGHTVSDSPLNAFWAVDLVHRILHVPQISEGVVGHYADGYEEVLALAKSDPAKAGRDSEALQLFALDVWANEVAAPGVGCLGELGTKVGPSETVKPAPTETGAAAACHTHSDGVVHCE